jgi:Flp pilus assembly pilin Flp
MATTSILSPWRTRAGSLARRLVEDESGNSHIEYVLIAVFVGTALIGSLIVMKDGLDGLYLRLAGILDTVFGG